MGEGKLTPLTTPTPLNRQSPNIADVTTSTISPYTTHLVKVAPGVTSPHIAKVTTQFLWTPAYIERSLLYFANVFFLNFFYGRLILQPRLMEVRETFTRGGP